MIMIICDLCKRSIAPEEPYYLLSVSYVDEEAEEKQLLGEEVETLFTFHICERCFSKKFSEVMK